MNKFIKKKNATSCGSRAGRRQARVGPTSRLTCEEARGGAQVKASSPRRCGGRSGSCEPSQKKPEQPRDQSSNHARPPVLKSCGRVRGGTRRSTGEGVQSSKMRRPFRFVRTFTKKPEQPIDQSSNHARPPVLKAVGWIRSAGSSPKCMPRIMRQRVGFGERTILLPSGGLLFNHLFPFHTAHVCLTLLQPPIIKAIPAKIDGCSQKKWELYSLHVVHVYSPERLSHRTWDETQLLQVHAVL